jgi:capsular polysaccharide transport system permease protein
MDVGPAHLPPNAHAPTRRRRLSPRLLSFAAVALLPTALAALYLFGFAADQYVSEFHFSVRQNQPTPIETGSLAQSLTGGTSLLAAAIDSEIVVEYLKSHQLLDDLHPLVNFDAIYATQQADWLTRLDPAASNEAKLRYWRRMIDPYFDLSSGLISVRVRSFTPATSLRLARAVLALSEALVNQLSERARHDKVAYSEAEVARTQSRFAQTELALAAYRNAHGIVFPQMNATENATLDAGLRQDIARAEAQYQTLRDRGVSPTAPALRALQSRTEALHAQLAQLQTELTQPGPPDAESPSPALATTLTGYDALDVADHIAQHEYEQALSLRQQAMAAAAQQQVYLNTFVQPNLPQASLYPQRWRTLLEVLVGSCVLWALATLLFYGVREHLD